ncbi:hypothetical protein ARMGADRAFT_1038737 [Armillaria gallica]|uniref:Uncharacterized protein n=1 Tax=Armillaria gallica TaxID=47427 RepID=A0A2H3CZT6_ARMGA|nr:hypothetical protein ARMGADRAFT_1038737 [Armillaria gallica]
MNVNFESFDRTPNRAVTKWVRGQCRPLSYSQSHGVVSPPERSDHRKTIITYRFIKGRKEGSSYQIRPSKPPREANLNLQFFAFPAVASKTRQTQCRLDCTGYCTRRVILMLLFSIPVLNAAAHRKVPIASQWVRFKDLEARHDSMRVNSFCRYPVAPPEVDHVTPSANTLTEAQRLGFKGPDITESLKQAYEPQA